MDPQDPSPSHDMPVPQNLGFHRKDWAAQRVAWALMLAVVIIAALGFFGDGGLARRTVGETGDPIQVEFVRFGRLDSPTRLRVHLSPQRTTGDAHTISLWFSDTVIRNYRIASITPEPERTRVDGDRTVFELAVGNDAQATVDFHLRPTQIGDVSGQIGVTGGDALQFRQFVYP